MANLAVLEGMPGAGLTSRRPGQAGSDRLGLEAVLGENPPYGILGEAVETSASFEARSRATALPDSKSTGKQRPPQFSDY